VSKLSCPSCAGEIEGVSPLIRSIDCSYCGSWLRLNNQIWEANSGQKTALNAPSFLRIGMIGVLSNDNHYKVMGRIRIQYEQDSWDEWWVEDNYGKGFWIEEDDGVYYLHNHQQEFKVGNVADKAEVAEDLSLSNGMSLYVTEKYEGTIVGREGFLPTDAETNSSVTYIDGVINGVEYSLEIENKVASLYQAEVLDIQSIRWESV